MRKQYDPHALPWGAGSIDQRGPDKWLARWREQGELVSKQFPTQDAAHTFLLDRWKRKQAGTFVAAEELTVQMLVEQWIERGSHLKPGTVYRYRTIAKDRIYPELGDLLVSSLTRYRIQHWIDTLRKRGLAPNTIQGSVTLLSASLTAAVELRILADNPVKGVRRPSVQPKPVTVWTVQDVQKVLTYLGVSSGRVEYPVPASVGNPQHHGAGLFTRTPANHNNLIMNLALYRLALTTGMRPGELLALQWRDIDGSRLTIRRTMTTDADGIRAVGTSTKTGQNRIIMLPNDTITALERWRQEQRITELPGYVFTNSHGAPLSRSGWVKSHKVICREAHVPYISLHKMRHTAATLMLELGQHPRVVQEILGHRDISTTMNTYSMVSEQMQRQTMDAMDEALRVG
jgi:integrase